jgi:hypothetical protein
MHGRSSPRSPASASSCTRRARTYVEIGRAVMARIAALAEEDRAVFAPAATSAVTATDA